MDETSFKPENNLPQISQRRVLYLPHRSSSAGITSPPQSTSSQISTLATRAQGSGVKYGLTDRRGYALIDLCSGSLHRRETEKIKTMRPGQAHFLQPHYPSVRRRGGILDKSSTTSPCR
uniref:Uncharacterized protein n=1 Tax=Knipowitschia caucasica TaxID=637954 RepID=A0AAV2LBP1_KNICA